MHCSSFDRGLCRSCTLMGVGYSDQVHEKEAQVHAALTPWTETVWLPTATSPEHGYRNKAKMIVGGTATHPTLGILDEFGVGIDLSDCGICAPELRDAFPALSAFIRRVRLTPYNVAKRRGDLKYVIVTVSPDRELMVRFVVRSRESIEVIRRALPTLKSALPSARVISVNIHPEHKAVVEGDEEVILTANKHLVMRLAGLELRLRPQSFFQTNTPVAAALYEQVRGWSHQLNPKRIWDLYCGVGGFALATVSDSRVVTGVETSPEAVRSARASAAAAGARTATFSSGDATEFALASHKRPDLVIVNPPRRGIGEKLATWCDTSGVPHIVYSSCNPHSLRADLGRLPHYRIREARLLDMFPQTAHCEVAVLLDRI